MMMIMRRLRRRRKRWRRGRRKRRYKVLEGSYSTWLSYYWGTIRFDFRLITQLALVCTG